jgi:hypothetical protein
MELTPTPLEQFEGRYARPIDKLAELPDGNGAHAALMIALPLYERYLVARLRLDGRPPSDAGKRDEVARDLGLDPAEGSKLWAVLRDGFGHHPMGRDGRARWSVGDAHGEVPEVRSGTGPDVVCVDPWKFARRVLSKYRDDPRLITAADGFPLADVFAA